LSGKHQILVYADNVNVLAENIINMKNTALYEANRKVSLEVNTQKTKYMVFPRHQNAGKLKITD
jgi:hypothetical protein